MDTEHFFDMGDRGNFRPNVGAERPNDLVHLLFATHLQDELDHGRAHGRPAERPLMGDVDDVALELAEQPALTLLHLPLALQLRLRRRRRRLGKLGLGGKRSLRRISICRDKCG